MVDLSKIGERGRLKPKRGDEPHWQRITNGCYAGFRPSSAGEARRRNRTDRAPNNDFAPRHYKWLRDCFDNAPAECLRLR